MDMIQILAALTDEGGLNIPAATLAFYCDVSPSAISAYLNGVNKPTQRMIGKLRAGIGQYVKEINGLYEQISD